eukprot:XP_011662361.1 PREDICTED: uncharacterized protein LOC105437460 [Strongylocentrotus purpuratus]
MYGYHCHCSTGFQGHNCDDAELSTTRRDETAVSTSETTLSAISSLTSTSDSPTTIMTSELPRTRRDGTAVSTSETTMSAISSSTSTSDPSTTNMTSESFAKIFVADSGEHKIFFADLRDELSFRPIPSTWHPEFLAYDSTRKMLYWNDFTAKQIYRADVNGLNREVVTFASNEAPAGVAIAEELGVLYIAYTLSNKITSMSIKPDKTIPRDDPDFATQGIKEPRALQTDEEQGVPPWFHHGFTSVSLGTRVGTAVVVQATLSA